MIRTQGLTKVYKNGFKAVDGLDLQIDEGDIFGFLGPNGAGKTTTIRMLDGLLQPTSGTAFIDGMDITKQPVDIRRVIGVVPESHGYYYSMTAQQYLKYFAALFDPRHDETAYVEYLLRRVGLYEKKDVAVGRFSRGMKQRLGVAKALINRPKVIFLDEPTLGLDPRGQHEIQQLLLEVNKTDGVTVFITSHLLKDIEVLCNKVCIVKDGKLIEQGSIDQLREKFMPNYTMTLNTSDNLRAVAELMNVGEILCVKVTDDNKLQLKLRSECTTDDIARSKHEIMTTMFSAGIDVGELSRQTLSMEDIFFLATGTEREAAAQ
jgi:ABC-2 type transport system ATP-binding protein